MPVLNRALQAQAPQGQPQPQQPSPTGMDPVATLMEEYKRLDPDTHPTKPMFTQEEGDARVDRNNSLADLGVLGSLTSDRPVGNMGAQVFKQALADRTERRTDRGIVDPLTGDERLDPEYVRASAEARRGSILQRALAYQQSRENQADRVAQGTRHDETLRAIGAGHDEARIAAKGMGGAGGGHNLVQVTDEGTGEKFWSDPRSGNYVKPVTRQDGSALVQPAKPTGGDEKELTAVATGKASVKAAIQAVTDHPDAFGPMKGAPDLLDQGLMGSAARYIRDNKSLTPDQVSARSMIYNNVSQVIKERAGTAQSAQELKRLQGFLPSEMDNAQAILAKMKAFDLYLTERGGAIRNKYAGPRPMQHMGGTVNRTDPNANGVAPTAPGAALKFNPTTGEIE